MHRSLQFVLFLLAICMVASGQDKPASISLKELIANLASSERAIRDIDVVETQELFTWEGDQALALMKELQGQRLAVLKYEGRFSRWERVV